MRQITVYKFSELKPELQKKIWTKTGWRENPFRDENFKSWEEFYSLFYDKILDFETYRKRVEYKQCSYYDEEKGKLLVRKIWRKFRDLPESPSGFLFDEHVFGYAKKILNRVMKGYNIEDFISAVFRHFCEEDEKADEDYNTFESFKEDAFANGWEYTETGIQI